MVTCPGDSEVKASACNAGDLGSIPGSGSSPGGGNGNPLQYSCLENRMDRGAWWATVHGVAKSWTRLSDLTYLLTYLTCPRSQTWKWWGRCVHPQSPPRRDVLGCRGQPSFLSSQSLNSDNEVPCQGCSDQLCPPQALLEWQARLEVFSEKGSLDLQGPAELLRLS